MVRRDMIHVARIGFTGVDAAGYDGPEKALAWALNSLEGSGNVVVGATVMRSSRQLVNPDGTPNGDRERYEAFVIFRDPPA